MRVAGKYMFISTSIILVILHLSVWIQDNQAFTVRKVFISGQHLLENEEILRVAQVDTVGSIWETDIESIEARLRELPQVRDVSVARVFPSNIHINIEERRPVALLISNGLWGIDGDGVLLPRFRPQVGLDFPVITGIRLPDQVAGQVVEEPRLRELAAFLAELQSQVPVVYNLISEVTISKMDGVRAMMVDRHIPVYFGRGKLIRKSKKLQAAWEYLTGGGKLSNVLYLDLRYDEQVIVKKKRSSPPVNGHAGARET